MSAAGDWERSWFATSGSELDIREALTALDRVLEHSELSESVREVLARARAALRSALA